MNDLITVYITNYNYENFLKKSIESVINQSYKNINLIIVDDASTDNSIEILNKFKYFKGVTLILNKKRIGHVKSSNKAIKLAKGKYILRLDADDYLKKNALYKMLKLIKKNSRVKMVFPNFNWINSKGKVLSTFTYKNKPKYFLNDQPAHGACSLIDLKFLKQLGGYCEKFDRQDGFYIWLAILLKKYEINNLNETLFFYRKHKKNLSKNKVKLLQAKLDIINYFLNKNRLNKEILLLKKNAKKKLSNLRK
mgnify:CR=1 FL=1